ncbi:MAG TPA: hypothetical protein VFO65_01145 [Acidimicrobiales bacterium]|nr:hypothetical protein [Acidimicrobiales bacterium]
MNDELDTNQSGMSRRTLIKRSAIAGGLVWAAPVVTSMSPAFGQTTAGTPDTQDISFVAALITCGTTVYRVKWNTNPDGTLQSPECGTSFAVDGCADQLPGGNTESCGSFVATFDANTGNLSVNLGTCTLTDFVVKCGSQSFDSEGKGCQDTNEVSQPNTGDTGTVTFVPCQKA